MTTRNRTARVLSWLLVSLAGLIVVCAAAYGYYLYSPAPAAPALGATAARETLQVGDRERSYLAYVPDSLADGAALVIVLHGSVMDGATIREWTGYEFDRWADRKGFAVVYPDGYQHNWNDCRKNATFPAKREHIDDMGFMRALIARMVAEHHVDPRKVFVFGYSNGGEMGFRLAIEAPDAIAAVAVAGANLPTADASSCAQDGATARVMLVDGTDDPINPYQGGLVTMFGFGSRGTALSSPASAEAFARRNGIAAQPVSTHLPHRETGDPTSVDRLAWNRGDTSVVVLYTVHGGGHVVPQPVFRYPRLFGRTTSDLDAPSAALHFFGLLQNGDGGD